VRGELDRLSALDRQRPHLARAVAVGEKREAAAVARPAKRGFTGPVVRQLARRPRPVRSHTPQIHLRAVLREDGPAHGKDDVDAIRRHRDVRDRLERGDVVERERARLRAQICGGSAGEDRSEKDESANAHRNCPLTRVA
jgi:hypothetical protein